MLRECRNVICESKSELCNLFNGYSPEGNPIHCPSGTCIDDICKSTTAFNIPTCNEGEFVRMNKCLKNRID